MKQQRLNQKKKNQKIFSKYYNAQIVKLNL